jgi:hypothetical protein
MSEAFSFRLSAETTWDENMKARPILSLTLPTAPRPSVGVFATNEAETHRPGFVKLTAGGLSDSVMPSRVQTHDKTFDVSPASALHNFVVASTRSASEGIHRRFKQKESSGTTGEKHRKPKQACLSENEIAASLKRPERSPRGAFHKTILSKPKNKGA